MAKKKWKRWLLNPDLREAADIARQSGMVIICGFTVSMCVHAQFGLYGTSEQMKATEKAWEENDTKFTGREPSYAFSIDVAIPREDWVD